MAVVTITTDFTGKVAGSLIENSNIVEKMLSESTYSPLYEGWTEFTQNEYDLIETSGGISYSLYSTPPNFTHILFSFNLISAIEKVYGQTLWRGKTTKMDKITIIKEIVSDISCTVVGKNAGHSFIYLAPYNYSAFKYGTTSYVNATTNLTPITVNIPSAYMSNYDENAYFKYRGGSSSAQYLYMDSASIDITLDDTVINP